MLQYGPRHLVQRLSSLVSSFVPRQAVAFYVIAIVAPTLALMFLGAAAVQRQRDALTQLTVVNERLRLERLADAIEKAVLESATRFLAGPRLKASFQSADWFAPEHLHRVRRELDAACRAEAMCADVVVSVVPDGGVPRLDEPLPRDPTALPDASLSPTVVQAFAKAERLEAGGDENAALAILQNLAQATRGEPLGAIVRARVARLHARRGETERARQVWASLLRDARDAYDLAQQPLAIVAALEIARLSRVGGAASTAFAGVLTDTRADLSAARWAVSPAQTDYFAKELDEASGQPHSWERTRLYRQLALARAVRTQLQVTGPSAPGAVRPVSLDAEGRSHQAYQTTVLSSDGHPTVVTVDTNVPWVQEEITPRLARDQDGRLAEPGIRMIGRAAGPSMFRTAFPFMTLQVQRSPRAGEWGSSELITFGGSVLGVLCVLVVSILLLMRDVARDASLAQVRTDLIHGVSHELKTPLSVIRLYAESLADDLAGDHPSAEQSRVILHESERLSHLVQRVLEFSRRDQGAPRLELAVQSPVALVDTFVRRYRPYLRHLGFEPSTEYGSDVPDIRVDADALTQALVNLVDNAVKYSGDSHVLILRVLSRLPAHVAIEVEDRGIGIADDDRRRVLEPFFRSRQTLGRGGYGLGLHLVARIMDEHGGAIELEAPSAGGTCVRLLLRAVQSPGVD